jgi:signal peptidase II
MTTTDSALATAASTAAKSRAGVYVAAAIGAAADLAAKAWAQEALPGRTISGGIIDLQLAYNPGVAFSVGNALPSWAVIAFTGLITLAVAVAAWRIAPRANLLQRAGLASVLAGAAANLTDRVLNGHVTDYLHTGWWPTFNMADVFIVCGAFAFAIGYLKANGNPEQTAT